MNANQQSKNRFVIGFTGDKSDLFKEERAEILEGLILADINEYITKGLLPRLDCSVLVSCLGPTIEIEVVILESQEFLITPIMQHYQFYDPVFDTAQFQRCLELKRSIDEKRHEYHLNSAGVAVHSTLQDILWQYNADSEPKTVGGVTYESVSFINQTSFRYKIYLAQSLVRKQINLTFLKRPRDQRKEESIKKIMSLI